MTYTPFLSKKCVQTKNFRTFVTDIFYSLTYINTYPMATGIKGICKAETFVTVYALNGTVIKRNVNKRNLTKVLRPGLYVVAGKKVWVKYNE